MTNDSEDLTTIVLAGNPNCGKTALFNALTGSRQRVGNWPGVTVDQKSGRMPYQGVDFKVVDLPGAYSISVISDETSIDERIACDYLLSGDADLVVNVIDGSNLERNLYLTLQLLEMHIPMVVAVNMMDVMHKRGIDLDLKKLSKLLDCPVVGIVASRGKGMDTLKETVMAAIKKTKPTKFALPLSNEIKQSLTAIKEFCAESMDRDWLALRLLEGDCYAQQHVGPELMSAVHEEAKIIEEQLGDRAVYKGSLQQL